MIQYQPVVSFSCSCSLRSANPLMLIFLLLWSRSTLMDVKRTLLSALPALQGNSSAASGSRLPGLDDEDMADLDVPPSLETGSRSFLSQPHTPAAAVVPPRIKSTGQIMLWRAREKKVEGDAPGSTEIVREGYVGLEGDVESAGEEGATETGKRKELLGKKLRELGWERWTDVFVRWVRCEEIWPWQGADTIADVRPPPLSPFCIHVLLAHDAQLSGRR